MIFYKIKLKSFPKVKFACTVCTDKYKNIITYRKNIIEFSINSGVFECEEQGNKTYIPPCCFNLCMPDMNLNNASAQCEKMYMSSVAIESDFEFERFDTDDIDYIRKILLSAEEIILPMYMELENDYTDIERSFKKLIESYLKESVTGELESISVWCAIAAKISEKFKNSILGNIKKNIGEYYSRKVKRYVEMNYSKCLTVKKIAEVMNISPNYLSSVFKKNDGRTLTEFIALTKLSHARQLIYEGKMNYTEIASAVGICNEKYLNRLFKKYYGTSVRKCKLIDQEISLYHDKPWEFENLTEDIFRKD